MAAAALPFSTDLLARVRALDLAALVERHGVAMERRGRSLVGLCPFHDDDTPSFNVDDVKGLWHCFGCGEGGDAIAFVQRLRGGTFVEAVRELADDLGLDAAAPPTPAVARVEEPPKRPPLDEVATLWAACRPVVDDDEVAAWLASRGLDPGDVEDRDLARALPRGTRMPAWASYWPAAGYRAILPMVDASGRMASLRARRVSATTDGRPKAVAPSGASTHGLVLADVVGRRMLAGDDDARAHAVRVGLIIAEGEPDYLSWATRRSDADEDAPAVLGLVAGAWTADLAARVPDGARVVIRTHHDDAGERYAAAVAASLSPRCATLRADTQKAPP